MSARRAIATALALAAASCVSGERDDVAEARAAHEQCREDHAGDERECAALRERLKAAQDRYQDNAQRAWGCVPGEGDCPAHR